MRGDCEDSLRSAPPYTFCLAGGFLKAACRTLVYRLERLPPLLTIRNESRSCIVAGRVRCADSLVPRLFGLLFAPGVVPGGGLLIRPSSGVHTFGMRFPIDVVALDKSLRVTGAWSRVGPWRIRGLSLKTRSVLELASGQIEATGLQVGDQLSSQATV